jgi:hypothetical protein
MNEEIKKEVQDAELNPEDLDKAAGGIVINAQNNINKCDLCGSPYELKFFSEDSCYYSVCSNPDCENAKKHGPKINIIGGGGIMPGM